MELQDEVTVTLTKRGARKLNDRNKELNNKCTINIDLLKTDYKEGDLLTSKLHENN